MNDESPGHQKSLFSSILVQKCPTCPVVGELCIEQVMACHSCGGMYMYPLKYRWLLVICQLFIDEWGNKGDPTLKLSRAQSTSGYDLVEARIFLARARSSAWMTMGSGHMDVSWLSRVVSTWLCLNSASTGAILVPGVTHHCMSKSCRNSDHLACCPDSFHGSLI